MICIKGPCLAIDAYCGLAAVHTDAGEHVVPELADLKVAAFDRRAHRVAEREQIGALQQQDLRLHRATAFELDLPQRQRKWILHRCCFRQQCARPDHRMQRVAECGDIDRQSLCPLCDAFDRPWQPGGLPGGKQEHQLRIGHPLGRPQQQGDDFAFAIELRVQFRLPGRVHLPGESERQLSGHRAMTGHQESGNARLLSGRHAAGRIEGAEEGAHAGIRCAGMARRWS